MCALSVRATGFVALATRPAAPDVVGVSNEVLTRVQTFRPLTYQKSLIDSSHPCLSLQRALWLPGVFTCVALSFHTIPPILGRSERGIDPFDGLGFLGQTVLFVAGGFAYVQAASGLTAAATELTLVFVLNFSFRDDLDRRWLDL